MIRPSRAPAVKSTNRQAVDSPTVKPTNRRDTKSLTVESPNPSREVADRSSFSLDNCILETEE